MQSPKLLRKAVWIFKSNIIHSKICETNQDLAIQDIIKACKELTAILPLDFFTEIIFDDPNLLVYLMLSSIYNKNAVQ